MLNLAFERLKYVFISGQWQLCQVGTEALLPAKATDPKIDSTRTSQRLSSSSLQKQKPWSGGTNRKWSGSQILYNDSSCGRTMPRILTLFPDLLCSFRLSTSHSESLAMGASLQGEKMYPKRGWPLTYCSMSTQTNMKQVHAEPQHTFCKWVIYYTKRNTHWDVVLLVISLTCCWLLILSPLLSCAWLSF